MMRAPSLLPALLCLPLVLGGCASTTKLTTRYLTDTPVDASTRLLLVARTPETKTRETWENTCADVLDIPSLSVQTSHRAMPLWYDAGNDHLLDWATKHGHDAILIAEITGMLLALPQVPAQNYMQQERSIGEDDIGSATWSFFLGRKEKETPPPPEVHEVEFQLVSPQGKMLWNGVGFTHEANELEAIARSQCKALKKNLQGLRLIP